MSKLIETIKSKQSAVNQLIEIGIPDRAKAVCIGEHKFIIEGASVCPECSIEYDDECEICGGDCDESGRSDLTVVVPWDVQKEIYAKFKEVLIEQLNSDIDLLKLNLQAAESSIKKPTVYGQKSLVCCACGCGRSKEVRKSDIDRGWGKYFSKSCKAVHQEKLKKENL